MIQTGALLIPLLAAVVTALATPLVSRIALARGQLNEARDDRWSTRVVPNVGGVAIIAGFAVAVLADVAILGSSLVSSEVAERAALPIPTQLGLVVAALWAGLLGFVDDRLQLSPQTKLVGQLVAAAILIVSGIGVWLTGIYVVDAAISAFWFVGITNALNLLDNMDGLAGGVGMIAALFLAVNFIFLSGQPDAGIVALALAGALLGFLLHNYPPARIFMGDSGSLFIGILLAGLALSPAEGSSRGLLAVVALPLVVLVIPILDTTYVTVTRILEGRPISQGGRDHTSHSLVALGMSEERALWVLWTLAMLGGLLGLLVRTSSRTFAYILVGVLLAGLGMLAAYLMQDRIRRTTAEAAASEATHLERLIALHQRYPVLNVALDFVLVGLAYFGAYVIRWDQSQLSLELAYFQRSVAILVPLKIVAFAAARLYTPRWRHFSLSDGFNVVRANLVGTLLSAAVLLIVARVGLSRGVLIIDFFLCTVMILGGRLSFRMIEGARQRWAQAGRGVALIGTLDDAEVALRALRSRPDSELKMVVVVDPTESREEAGAFHSCPVYGGVEGLRKAVDDVGVSAVLLVEGTGSSAARTVLDEYLATGSGLDTFTLTVELRPGLPDRTGPEILH